MMRALCAAGMLLAAAAASAAEPLGRLFYTPAQRAQLDTLRSQKNVAPPVQEAKEPPAAPEVLTYGGIVRRSDGRSTVWINNRMVNDGKAPDDLSISSRSRSDDRVRVRLPQAPGPVELRVGQSFDVQTGTVTEPYARRTTDSAMPSVRTAPPPPGNKSDTGHNARRDRDDEEREQPQR
ncbi:MAG: hypothetical protein ACT4PS_14240 [Betaproteobacteria bacterium]